VDCCAVLYAHFQRVWWQVDNDSPLGLKATQNVTIFDLTKNQRLKECLVSATRDLLVNEGLDGMSRTVKQRVLAVIFDLELEAAVALVHHDEHTLVIGCVET
jgi:hypothetical protein